jgi:hypothetical protein
MCVALATLAVVVATFIAARAAVRSARATEGLLATQLAPRLVNAERPDDALADPDSAANAFGGGVKPPARTGQVVVDVDDNETLGFCSVPVRNVGAGLARIRSVQVEVRLRGAIAPRVHTTIDVWTASKRFLPSGETTRINFTIQQQLDEEVVRALPYAVRIGGGVAMIVRYSAAESETEIGATFSLGRPDRVGDWRVLNVFHSDLPESVPRV